MAAVKKPRLALLEVQDFVAIRELQQLLVNVPAFLHTAIKGFWP